MNHQNNNNLLLATAISMLILLIWTWFYEKPKLERLSQANKISKASSQNPNSLASPSEKVSEDTKIQKNSIQITEKEIPSTLKLRKEILEETKNSRIRIENEMLHGSISLRGARFDDLTLAKYFKDQNKKEEVILFSPAESKERYFVDFGWISSDPKIELPTPETLWHSNDLKLSSQNPVNLFWKNNQGIEFKIEIGLDENYMFKVSQSTINNSGQEITLATYGRINRSLNEKQKSNYILHEGPIGTFKGILNEVNYEKILKEKNRSFNDSGSNGSWLGITDKYWLSSLIPDRKLSFEASFNYEYKNKNNLYSSEFIGEEIKIAPNSQVNFEHHLFAGAKKVKILDNYSKELDLKLFDRAIDFGWFYFLTKPFFFIIDFLNRILGNFGLAILGMTIVVKGALFPMANKSYAAIARLKTLQPKISAIRERYKDDKLALNREMMEMYKREKINPAAGCLPVLIQIPVFFALYKVLFVTLDMRQAPFYGWIHDLSAPDPTSIFNLFGLLPFAVSQSFTIGIWPILMGATMIIQQKFSPPVSDQTQATVMKFMPYILTFVLASFPAGLVIYWTWSNVLSIIQQAYINKRLSK